MQPLAALARSAPIAAAGAAIFPAVAVLAVLVLACERPVRRDFGFAVAAAVLLAAVILMTGTIKICSYALWFGMPPIAMLVPRFCVRLKLETTAARIAAAVLFAPAVLSGGAIAVVQAAGNQSQLSPDAGDKSACLKNASYAALAQLPRGLVATDTDFGPFVLALTPHSVLAAPYHRLSAAIVTSHRVFTAPPDKVRRILADIGANYVATCGQQARGEQSDDERRASLAGQLAAGIVPAWLERLPETRGQVFSVYRVKQTVADAAPMSPVRPVNAITGH